MATAYERMIAGHVVSNEENYKRWKEFSESVLLAIRNTPQFNEYTGQWHKLFPTTPTIGDPDGPLVPLPAPQPAPRVISAPDHDFIAALYRPYHSPI